VRELEVLFYENGRGGVAVSVDGGEHVVISTGRTLLLADTAWEESGEEPWDDLTEPQKAAIVEARERLLSMNEAQSDLDEIVLNYRKRRLHEARRSPTRAAEKTPRRS